MTFISIFQLGSYTPLHKQSPSSHRRVENLMFK